MKDYIPLKNVLESNFRANPNYELALFDRLPPEQQTVLSALQKDPDLYGILRPRQNSGLGIKSICRETALLCFTLHQSGALPAYVRATFGETCNQAIAELVLDGVLEIEREVGSATFVSGSDAYHLLFDEKKPAEALGKLARLSIEALKYAQALEINEPGRLSARIYFYNRLPASPEWLNRFPGPDAVGDYLGIQEGGANRDTLRRNWSSVSLTPPYDGWRMWQSRDRRLKVLRPGNTFKLYVSPACEALREAFGSTLHALTRTEAIRFKIGLDLYGLLRPDKMVAYFRSFEEMKDAAVQLKTELNGCPAHGVPFTAELDEDGLLSWGMDPPPKTQVLGWQEQESWRLWLTNRLAASLILAKDSSKIEPWRFAMERLELEGVNTVSWVPQQTIWTDDWPTKG